MFFSVPETSSRGNPRMCKTVTPGRFKVLREIGPFPCILSFFFFAFIGLQIVMGHTKNKEGIFSNADNILLRSTSERGEKN